MASFASILHFCFFYDGLAEVTAQILRGAQIYFASAQDAGQLAFHAGDAQQTGDGAGLEFDQHVHVAIGPKITVHDRPKKRQTADVMFSAECRDPFIVYGYLYQDGTSPISELCKPRPLNLFMSCSSRVIGFRDRHHYTKYAIPGQTT
jgi:hypothetical protein